MDARFLAPVLACLLMTPASAAASTLPRVDFQGGEIFGAVGTLAPVRGAVDLSVDWVHRDDESIGLAVQLVPLTGAPPGYFRERLPGLWLAAGRVVRRWGRNDDGLTWGGMLSAGLAPVFADTTATVVPPPNFWFVQPALVASWNFALFGFDSALRGSLGPVISLGGVGTSVGSGAGGGADFGVAAWVWPNLEFAVRVARRQEVTLGGNSVIGWRSTF